MSMITAREMLSWGLRNLWENGREGAYAVRHGNQPVSDFGRPRRSAGGGGGTAAETIVPADFADHVRWALRYRDRRFRTHETFPFRPQALGSARIQMQRHTFHRHAHVLSTITMEKMQRAQDEEDRGTPITDPAIRLLRQRLYSTAGRVVGTDQSRYQLRSQIWATPIMLNPPREKIDPDKFVMTAGPLEDVRARNIARDPYAAAKFFHFTINNIIQTPFGITVTPHQVFRRKGVFGFVNAYFGVVESQGRSSLHLHMLLWLKNATSMEDVEVLLKQDDFRERAKKFIQANIRAYLPGLQNAEAISIIPNG
ncbi:hypothetical protein F5141DRAFT_1130978, partial [Pisolithus sp. B1]